VRGGTPGGSSRGALNLVISVLLVIVLVLLILVLGQRLLSGPSVEREFARTATA
jgi:FtsH-binding integral membrane protein